MSVDSVPEDFDDFENPCLSISVYGSKGYLVTPLQEVPYPLFPLSKTIKLEIGLEITCWSQAYSESVSTKH